MPVVDVLIALVLGAMALRSRLTVALGAVVAAVMLLPNTLVLPGSPTSLATTQRVAVLALLVNLLVRVRRRQIPAAVFDITPIHAVFLAYLGVTFVLGVILAQPVVAVVNASQTWGNYFDEFVFFVVGLATVRAIGNIRSVLRVFTVLLVLTALIAIVEHFVEASWASMFYQGTGQEAPTDLAVRGDDVRVRVGSGFSLAYAWWAAAVLPFVLVYLHRRRTRRWYVVPSVGVVILALYWTQTRSVAIPVLFALLVIPLLTRERVFALFGVVSVGLMLAAFATSSAVSSQFSSSIDQGSIDIRFARIPPITSYVADHAYGGLGFTGLESLNFRTVDSSYLLIYGEIGVIGLTMLGLLYVTALLVVARGVLAVDNEYRLISAAAALGIGTIIGAGFVFDAVTQLEDQRLLWLITAVGVVAAERSMGPPRWLAMPTPSRLVAVAAGVGGGFLLLAAAPTHVAATYTFATISPYSTVVDNPPNIGETFIESVCDLAAVGQFSRERVELSCRDLDLGPGQGELRIQAPDKDTAAVVLTAFVLKVRELPHLGSFRLLQSIEPRTGRPTVLRTAPVWLPMLIGAGALLLPDDRARRRRFVTRSARTPVAAGSG